MRFILPFVLSIAFTPLSWSANFEKGLVAYKNGDYATALREWTPLAEEGDAKAQHELGGLYDLRRGVVQDRKTAVKWFTRSAEEGYADAQYTIGLHYLAGAYVIQDYETAMRWFLLAAGQGHDKAQWALGDMYHDGVGVRRNPIYAHMWWNIASSLKKQPAWKYKIRADLEVEMSLADVLKAQKLARECVAKNYKGC